MAEVSKAKWKKWAIALAILVALAIIVMVIVFTVPKNINRAKQAVASHSETAFLNSEDEQKLFSSFERIIEDNAPHLEMQVADAEDVAIVINNMLNYYDNFLYLAQNNSTFQKEYNSIMNAFKSADRNQAKMNNVLTQVYEKVENSKEFAERGEKQFLEAFAGYLNNYIVIFNGLSNVFQDCIPKGAINNPLVCKTLNTLNDFLVVISENGLEKRAYVTMLNNFVKSYLTDGETIGVSPIYSYNYQENLQLSFQKIDKFSSLYEGQTIRDVIKTTNGISFSFKKNEADTDGALDIVTSFLKGELK